MLTCRRDSCAAALTTKQPLPLHIQHRFSITNCCLMGKQDKSVSLRRKDSSETKETNANTAHSSRHQLRTLESLHDELNVDFS